MKKPLIITDPGLAALPMIQVTHQTLQHVSVHNDDQREGGSKIKGER